MKKFLNVLFVTLGVVFVIVLLVGAGFYISYTQKSGTPYTATSVTKTTTDPTTGSTTTSTSTASESIPITLTESQKDALRSFGIDPAKVPSSISSSQVACFEAKLGVARVAEIRAGSNPTPMDFFKAKGCI